MDISTLLPEAVEWSEGMLLSPQHLQQNDIYWGHQLRHLASALHPYYWGLINLEYDETALAKGLLRITQLQALMPDGFVVQYPGHTTEPLQLNVNNPELWHDKRLHLYLAIPVREEGAASSQSRIQRFDRVAGALEADECQLESRLEVGRLRPRLTLLGDKTVPAKFVALPLLALEKDSGEHLRVADYHPPMLRFAACHFMDPKQQLPQRLSAITKNMRSKIRDLVGGRRLNENPNQLNTEARVQLFVARHLAALLPSLELQLQSGMAHPYNLYIKLAELAGHLAAIGTNPSPPVVDQYNHDDLLPGFNALISFIEQRLNLIHAQFEAMLFEHHAASLFSRALSDELLTDRLLIEIRPKPGQTESQLKEWVSQARVASEALMPLLEQRRLPGCKLRQVNPRQYTGLNLAEGALLYELENQTIEQQGQEQNMILASSPLVIQGPQQQSAPRDIVLHRDLGGDNGKEQHGDA
ncbi:type VI secretion system baseplate subunit TssK [Gallaecimonas mangrovi]|uniref:type VI secretion system baseplate subunit TssK n=1 Tax=Gallaecimonas mangrovi TaxID=2291597 RepID=UPI000E1FDD4E|nr:type VI secretion system baseplate subunit TssK [Gallaecimonas mangrovi]